MKRKLTMKFGKSKQISNFRALKYLRDTGYVGCFLPLMSFLSEAIPVDFFVDFYNFLVRKLKILKFIYMYLYVP